VDSPTLVSEEDRFAADLRGFGAPAILAIVVILSGNLLFVPLSALLVLAWARGSRTPWREIGFSRPGNPVLVLVGGVVFGVGFKVVMKAVVMPLLGADPVNHVFHYLTGNRAALPGALYTLIVGAGFGEETLFRGFLFERFGKLFGTSGRAKALTVLITSVAFALGHTYQGLPGVEQALVTGLVFGTIMAITGRIWLLMVAHAAFDLAALWIIYWDLETRVAHLIFH
jgi:membrane protease YdiL (CAAX protease family)